MSNEIDVIIDSNERAQSPFVYDAVCDHGYVSDVVVRDLPVADIEIQNVGFERKAPADLLASLNSDRMDSQLSRLDQRYDSAYILIDGTMHDIEFLTGSDGMFKSVLAFIAAATARDGSGVDAVIPCGETEHLVDLAIRLASKTGAEYSSEFEPDIPTDPDAPTAQLIYRCVDGIGPQTAEVVYEAYPTVSDLACNATQEELTSLEGIGQSKAAKLAEVFGI